jgi:hypothetical protein
VELLTKRADSSGFTAHSPGEAGIQATQCAAVIWRKSIDTEKNNREWTP